MRKLNNQTQELPLDTTKKKKKSSKHKADVFQRVFNNITGIVQELWLERKTDQHNPIQWQQRMTKLTEATQTVKDLYFLQTLIMPQHKLTYFALLLIEMLEQSSSRMMAWATTRWKIRIFQSICSAKLRSKKLTVPLWKMWEPDCENKPVKKVDCGRVTE